MWKQQISPGAVQCVPCESQRRERQNISSYTWTFVLPARPTDEGKVSGNEGEVKGWGKNKMEEEWREREEEGSEGERDLKLQKLHVQCRV